MWVRHAHGSCVKPPLRYRSNWTNNTVLAVGRRGEADRTALLEGVDMVVKGRRKRHRKTAWAASGRVREDRILR